MAAAAPLLLACAFARVWGQPAQALGNLLAVVLLLGTDDALPWRPALDVAAVFMAGGAWALLLTLAIWRIHPYGPARRAVADVWAALADQTRMIRRLRPRTKHCPKPGKRRPAAAAAMSAVPSSAPAPS